MGKNRAGRKHKEDPEEAERRRRVEEKLNQRIRVNQYDDDDDFDSEDDFSSAEFGKDDSLDDAAQEEFSGEKKAANQQKLERKMQKQKAKDLEEKHTRKPEKDRTVKGKSSEVRNGKPGKFAPKRSNSEAEAEAEAGAEAEADSDFFDGASDSDSDSAPEETPSQQNGRKRGKHAPAEASTKKPVPRIREIPGLEISAKYRNLYQDLRFDTAYGKADFDKARRDYAFLDQYREEELADMKEQLAVMKRRKEHLYGSADAPDDEATLDLKQKIQRYESQLKALREKDFKNKVLRERNMEERKKIGEGKKPFFLKRSAAREFVNTEKFKTLKKKQVDKIITRRRKKNLAKERKGLPFL